MATSPLPIGDASALGFDANRLALIGPAMEAYVADKRVPNLVTLVARRGQIVHFEARGVLDLDSDQPAGKETLFRMFSNTKPIAGVATLILAERGVLTPDDPVSRFLPEFSKQQVRRPSEPMATDRARRGITIRDCLTNTTGLTSPATMPNFYRQQYRDVLETLGWISNRNDEDRTRPNNRERVEALAQLPLAAHPGDSFGYHLGYPILGAVLEAASGQPLDVFFRDNIFDPLAMVDTDFYVKDGALDRFGACYVPRREGDSVQLVATETAETSEKNTGPKTEFGAGGDSGGVLSTAGDYARFGQMLLNGGELDGERILGRKTVDIMIGNHTGDMEIPMTGPGFHWGLGVATYHGRNRPPLVRSVGTYGWGGAAGTTYFADPAEELLGVCLTQVLQHGMMPNNNYQETFQRLTYQALI
tara:strand:+ start:1894 stop:3147 length:1254 start_codon:yes stop_codon:yes gene_type:complete